MRFWRPLTTDCAIETGHRSVSPGEVAGIHHEAFGVEDGDERLTLDLKMSGAQSRPRASLRLISRFGGIFGDTVAVAMLVNTGPSAADAEAGLQTMADLPVPRAFGAEPVLVVG